MQKIAPRYDYLVITLLAAFFFLPFLGGVHLFDWDEINFAECAREMLVLGDYLRIHINFEPFWEKPPLFFWLQVLSMKLWGINEYAARFPNAICGILSLLILFSIGKKMANRTFAYAWVLAYLGSILPHLYFKSGIIDPWFNLFIFLGIYFLFEASWRRKAASKTSFQQLWKPLLLAGVCTGLAVLTKGPVAGLVTALVLGTYWLWNRCAWFLHVGQFLFYGMVVLATAGLWFGVEMMQNGTWFVETFTRYQIRLLQTEDAGHGGFFGYHFVVLLIGVFPSSIFALRQFWRQGNPLGNDNPKRVNFRIWMLILFWVVLILFSLVQSKIVHYSSLCYFPLTFLAALRLEELLSKQSVLSRLEKILFIGIAVLFGIILLALPYLGQHPELLRPLLAKDPFALGNLEAQVDWSAKHWIPALIFISLIAASIYLYKKQKLPKATWTLFIGMAFFVNSALIFFINNIEAYSQRAVIEFYKSKQDEDCYIHPTYRTYADLFYTRKQPIFDKQSNDEQWLCEGAIDKDVFLITKIQHSHRLAKYPDIVEIGRKNGFVFFERKAFAQ